MRFVLLGTGISALILWSVLLSVPVVVTADTASSAGLPAGTLMTEQDQKLLFGGCSSDMWEYLKKHTSDQADQGNGRSLIPRNGNPGIQSGLACRLYNFFHYLEQNNCKPQIISAFRSTSVQAEICGSGGSGCAAAGKSCHQYGAAVDVSGCVDKMRSLLKNTGNQFKLHFPYYGPHIQCVEHKTAGASSCAPPNPPCAGGTQIDYDQIPPEQNQIPHGYTPGSNSDTDGAGEAEVLKRLEQEIKKTDATGVTPGSAGTTAGSNPISNAIQQALSSPTQQSATPESNTTSNAFKCLFAAFGSDAEGCADTQARALLGEELGVIDGEDTVVGSTGNDTLSNTAACSDSGSSISRSDTGCLQVGGQGGADNNVPAISTGSVTQTIKDSAVTDSVGAPGPVAQKFVSLGQMFDWPSSTGSPASQYDGQLFYRGQDLPDGLYYDLYTDTIRYESSGREVSPAVLKVLMSEDASSLASTQSISWLGVTGSLVRGALPVLGFTFPLASFFSI